MRLVRSRRAGRLVFYAARRPPHRRLFEQGLEHVGGARSGRDGCLHRLRAARRVDLQDRGDGLPRGGRDARAPFQAPDGARGASTPTSIGQRLRQVRRGEADHRAHRGRRRRDRHARVARARGAARRPRRRRRARLVLVSGRRSSRPVWRCSLAVPRAARRSPSTSPRSFVGGALTARRALASVTRARRSTSTC